MKLIKKGTVKRIFWGVCFHIKKCIMISYFSQNLQIIIACIMFQFYQLIFSALLFLKSPPKQTIEPSSTFTLVSTIVYLHQKQLAADLGLFCI